MTALNCCAPLLIVIPYRDRLAHLLVLAPHLQAFLDARGIQHQLLVVEQSDHHPFNRGQLLNIGFHCSQNLGSHVCFHDVDLLPANSSCDYTLNSQPVHLSGRSQQYRFQLPYETYFGGVTLFPNDVFRAVNGFSNRYWGWGREDDDLYLRLRSQGYDPVRRPGEFLSQRHPPAPRDYIKQNTVLLRHRCASARAAGLVGSAELDSILQICSRIPPLQEEICASPIPSGGDGLTSTRFSVLSHVRLNSLGAALALMSSSHELLRVNLELA